MSDSEELELDLLLLLRMRNRQKRKRAYGIHPLRRSKEHGHYSALFRKLSDNEGEFRKYTRMARATFQDLLSRVGPSLKKRSLRESVNPEQRLLLTLRYLATGESFRSLSLSYYLGESTVGTIVHETCRAIVAALKGEFLVTPSTADEWRAVADGFWERWQLPNTLGAIDGKHVQVRRPANSGSLYHNYKGTFSTVMLAVADSRYRIIYLSVGSYGHEGDAGIFDRSDLAAALADPANPLDLPPPAPLPGTNTRSPFFFVGDEAFPLKEYLMKPYPQQNLGEERRIYNYRISRGRRIVESTFGILSARWRLLLKPIESAGKNLDHIVEAICCLHNYLCALKDTAGVPAEQRDDALMQPAQNLINAHANHAPLGARMTQSVLQAFFNNAGAVEWQWEMI